MPKLLFNPMHMRIAALFGCILLLAIYIPLAPGNSGEKAVPPAEGRAPPRPDHMGGLNYTGFMYESFQASFKTYAINMKLWYPAKSSGENATPESSGAPYPLILQLPPMGGTEEQYNSIAQRIVSWGFLLVTVGQNWNNDADCLNISVVNEMLAQLERDNATSGHKYQALLERDNYGISGWSRGGAWSLIDGCFINKFRAVQGLVPALGASTTDQLVGHFDKPLQIQIGELDSTYRDMGAYACKVLSAPKGLLDIKGGQHGGPFMWDAYLSFFIRYLKNDTSYEYYLYDRGAMDDAANLAYYLNFTTVNGTFFPPGFSVLSDRLDLDEDQKANFTAIYSGYVPFGHPRGSFRWDFTRDGQPDDGGPANLTSSWVFTRSGNIPVNMWYQLGLLAINMNNSVIENVRNIPPSASAGEDREIDEDSRSDFTGSGSDTPSDMATLQYSWNFGDGNGMPFGPSPATGHSYSRSGNFTATLTVKDDDGATAADPIKVTVRNLAPLVRPGGNITVNKDEEVALTGEGADTASDLPSLLYMWSFGDNTSTGWSDSPFASHTYTRSGNFTATISVKDGDGAASNAILTVTVLDTAPVAAVGAPRAKDEIDKDSEVSFSGKGTDTASDQASLQLWWDFGDGNASDPSADAATTHTYTRGGTYTASLHVRDADGYEGLANVTFKVVNQLPEAAIISPTASQFNEDDKVRFSAEGTDTESDQELLNYSWDIGGAEYHGKQLELRFTQEGTVHYKVTVRDPEGAEATAEGSLEVKNPNPVIVSDIGPLDLFVNDTANYTLSVKDTASDITILTVLWEFGDGSTSDRPNGTHGFSKAGNYNIKVTVRDDENGKASHSFTVRVQERPQQPPPPPQTPTVPEGRPVAAAAAATVAAILVIAAVAFLVLRRRRRGNIQ
jgi:PKD repeat protein/dienelactone hydrolase